MDPLEPLCNLFKGAPSFGRPSNLASKVGDNAFPGAPTCNRASPHYPSKWEGLRFAVWGIGFRIKALGFRPPASFFFSLVFGVAPRLLASYC